jgi:hypothetical protein
MCIEMIRLCIQHSCRSVLTGCRCAIGPSCRVFLAGVALAWSSPIQAVETSIVLLPTFQLDDDTVYDMSPGDLLGTDDYFGSGVASIGDFDGDGVPDIAVGARHDDDGGSNNGAVYILLLNPDGSVKSPSPYKIGEDNDPNNAFQLSGGKFGNAVTWLGDYDGDGNYEIAVGEYATDAPTNSGTVWVIDLDANAVPQSAFPIRSGSTNFVTLDAEDLFGYALANLGDWNNDGAPELAATALRDADGGTDNGAVYILYLDPNPGAGAILSFAKISDTEGGFTGAFDAPTEFGSSVTTIGDLDGDTQIDLAVGAGLRGPDGSVWILFMDPGCQALTMSPPNTNCVVKPSPEGFVEITEGTGGFQSALSGDQFGFGIAWLPDEGGFQPDRLAVGESKADTTGTDYGAVWILTLDSTGNVTTEQRIADPDASTLFAGRAGWGLDTLGDLNDDGVTDLMVGAPLRNINETDNGVVFLINLDPCARLLSGVVAYHSPADDGLRVCPPAPIEEATSTLHLWVDGGDVATAVPSSVCALGLGEGKEICGLELRVVLEGGATIESFTPAYLVPPAGGEPYITGERTNTPTMGSQKLHIAWVAAAAPLGPFKVGDLEVAFDGSPDSVIRVGAGSAAVNAMLGLAPLPTSVIALPEPSTGLVLLAGVALLLALPRRSHRNARQPWFRALVGAILLAGTMPPSATAQSIREVALVREAGALDFPDSVPDRIGRSIAYLGPMGEHFAFALGAPRDPPSCMSSETVWIVFLDQQGTGIGFTEVPRDSSGCEFGFSLLALDLDSDGFKRQLLVGSPSNGSGKGSLTFVELNDAGNIVSRHIIDDSDLSGSLTDGDRFGWSLTEVGDIDGNSSTTEVAVGARGDDDGGSESGAAWILSLNSDGSVAWDAKIGALDPVLVGALDAADRFGYGIAGLGDLDADGVPDLAVGATKDSDGGLFSGAVYILFLNSDASVKAFQKISAIDGGFNTTAGYQAFGLGDNAEFGRHLRFHPVTDAGGRGVLYASKIGSNNTTATVYALFLDNDGTVEASYAINEISGVGYDDPGADFGKFGASIELLGSYDSVDETLDIAVGAPGSYANQGAMFLFFMEDADDDEVDDLLDNCPNSVGSHNPTQSDTDLDGVGDVCDNCPGKSNSAQTDSDGDGVGNTCEPVKLILQPTQIPLSTPAAPSWDLLLACGAFDVTDVNAAIVLPSGMSPPLLTLSGSSIGSSTQSGPGLSSPQRGDAIYFSASGNIAPDNRLCNQNEPAVQLGTLACNPASSCPIGGTQLASAALTAEGVTGDLAADAIDAIPPGAFRFVNGPPVPVADLELGPAVTTGVCSGGTNDGGGCSELADCAGGTCVLDTRWEVCLTGTEEFHRVAFGLIAPAGTTTSDIRWLGCDSAPDGSGQRTCTGGGDFSPSVNAAKSWTVGPLAVPAGNQLPDTLYAVLEGNRFSSGLLGLPPTLNFQDEPICIGRVELSGAPALGPALTTDGILDIDDLFNMGTPVTPFELVDNMLPIVDPTQVKLIGSFNPADDVDGDGVQDLGDNCPFFNNPQQKNQGSFLNEQPESDFLGDACQCGESTDNGAVTDASMPSPPPPPYDIDKIFDLLAGNITNSVEAADIAARCSVVGTTECNIRDLVVLSQAIANGDGAVDIRCDAALSPPSGP